MRKWVFVAVIGLAWSGSAVADSKRADKLQREFDESRIEFGPPSVPVDETDKDLIDDYLRRKRSYDEAVGRTAVYNSKKLEEIQEQQKELLEKLKEASDD